MIIIDVLAQDLAKKETFGNEGQLVYDANILCIYVFIDLRI